MRWTWPKGKPLSEKHKNAIRTGALSSTNSGRFSLKTHCKNGHAFAENPPDWNKSGEKSCYICYRIKHPRAQPRLVVKRTPAEKLFLEYQRGAQRRSIPWTLTIEQFQSIISQPCHYTGRAPTLRRTDGRESLLCNGIDRKDSTRGYDFENCVPCCKEINMLKRALPYKTFISFCKEVAQTFQSVSEE